MNKLIAFLRRLGGYDLYDNNLVVLCAFDGVLHSFTSGWHGDDVIPDAPVPGAIEWLQDHLPVPDAHGMAEHHKGPIVQIYSARSRTRRGRNAMKEWLIDNGLPSEYITDGLLKFPTKRPRAHVTIEAQTICFDGRFPTEEQMTSFRPWNRK